MKKFLIVIAIIVGLGIASFVALAFFLGGIITKGVNRYGPGITQTRLTLTAARVSPVDGIGALNGLVIGNPKGWSEDHLCSLGEIHVRIEPFSVMGDHIIVHEIRIDAADINYETRLISSNIGDLLKNIEATMGSSSATPAPMPASSGKPIKFEVRKFTLANGKVRLGVLGKSVVLPMPTIELTDLGTREGGITADQFAHAVVKSVTSSVLSATGKGAGDIGATSGAAAAEGVKRAGEAIKDFFGGGKK